MRDLTAEELALAPEWATHAININYSIIQFESSEFYVRFFIYKNKFGERQCNKEFGISSNAVKLPRKPFDITQHEFSDERLSFSDDTLDIDIGCCAYYDDSVTEVVNYDFNKADAIAIAKHFKLTAEDLK